jgi:predicted RNA binding protein YcfA (HicA-like mRNA interferase family)
MLLNSGFEFVRSGKGDHKIFRRGQETVVVPGGKKEIASGMVRRILHTVKRKCS